MKILRISIPIIAITITTALIVLVSIWLTGLVPAGEWSEFLKALIIVVLVGTTLFVIVWSAYFSYVIRETIERYLSGETSGKGAKK